LSRLDDAADKLESKADSLGGEGGVKGKVAEELAEDAAFLRKLKPRLMLARARGQAPTNETPGKPRVAPSGPQIERAKKKGAGGPSPWLVIGVAVATGIVLAKIIDWRGHAHPRD
jgi:hypothetical protein